MRIAITNWQNRVSPVFDVAAHLTLLELDDRFEELTRQAMTFSGETCSARARQLSELGVDVLICGAISQAAELALLNSGIEIISQICGDTDRVLAAFMHGTLADNEFLMPGCCGRRRAFRHGAANAAKSSFLCRRRGRKWGNR